jgi:molecular chaperone GrpE
MEEHINNIENEENQENSLKNEEQEQSVECPVQELQSELQAEKETKSGGFFSKKDKKNSPQAEIEKLKAEHAELNDKFLRLYSEFDNYRKRTQKEKLDIIQNASESLIISLLPIIDDMERALKYSGDTNEDIHSIKEGQVLILQKLNNLLKQKGLKAINTENETFDTDYHEAISIVPAPSEEEKGKILEEVEKGYTLNDKVIRYSKVVIYQ